MTANHPLVELLRFVLIAFMLLGTGCGGGSAGTGVGGEPRVISGTVESSDGDPIESATVTIVETGESAVTNSDGAFVLVSESNSLTLNLFVETSQNSATVPIDFAQGGSSTIELNIVVDPETSSGTVSGYDLRVKIESECDPYFENSRTIRQANAIPQGKSCPLRVSMRSARGGLPYRNFILERRRCAINSPWKLVAAESTNEQGRGEIRFSYFDNPDFCLYRVLMPLNDNKIAPREWLIVTQTFQNLK